MNAAQYGQHARLLCYFVRTCWDLNSVNWTCRSLSCRCASSFSRRSCSIARLLSASASSRDLCLLEVRQASSSLRAAAE